MRFAISRRTLVGAGAGTLVSAGIGRQAAAEALLSQQAAEYQATPRELQMCGTCTMFIGPDGCKVVEGPVARQGWCRLYDPVD